MDKVKVDRKAFVEKYFCARELQITVAFLAIVVLLAGIFLQVLSSALKEHYGMGVVFVGGVLVIGYLVIVVLIAIFFTHRLIGPFKRIEYEMKMIAGGELTKRIGIRTQDDLHVRNFVAYANKFIDSFEKMSKDYNGLNSAVSTKLGEISAELSKEKFNCVELKAELIALQKKIHTARERW